MESNEQIEVFKEFIEQHYKSQLYEMIQLGKKSLAIDFTDLLSFNTELSDDLLENPDDTIRAAELSIEQFDLPEESLGLRVRFKGLPESQKIKISNIRSEHLGQFIYIEGIVRQASDVRPQITNAKFECAGCGNTISILQIDTKFKEPTRCTCGWRGKFRLLKKDLIDVQHLKIEESPESLEGGEQPKRLSIFLKEDLVEPRMEKRTTPGSRINIYGVVKEVPIQLKLGAQSVRYDLILEANNIESVQEDFSEITLKKEDEEQIRSLSLDPRIFDKLTKAIAPSIYGHEKIKEALVLQLMGGVRKQKPDGIVTRGDVHVLLVGDPGSGKSQILQFMSKAAPKARFVSGKGASVDYNEPLIIKKDNQIQLIKIGSFVDSYSENIQEKFVRLHHKIETLSVNLKTKKVEWKEIGSVYRHKINEKLLKFTLESGREVTTTKDHSIFILENGKLVTKNASRLKIRDCAIIPSNIPNADTKIDLPPGLARLMGYYIAEGHMRDADSSYKIEFTLNKNEEYIINDIKFLSKTYLNSEAKSYPHGDNGVRVIIYRKEAYNKFASLLGEEIVNASALTKRIPAIILNSNCDIRKEFINGYMAGDAGVTKSRYLMSDLLYLYLEENIIASCNSRLENGEVEIKGRKIIMKGYKHDLKAPHPKKRYTNRYSNPPYESLSKVLNNTLFKRVISNDYSRVNLKRIGNRRFFYRLNYISENILSQGKDLKSLFGESALEYFADNSNIFTKIRNGRQCLISLSDYGVQLMQEISEFKSLMNGDLGFVRIKKIEEVDSSSPYVYDVSVPENENFIGGFGGLLLHNSGAGLTAAVVKDEFLKGWALEAGALVLANKGLCVVDELDKIDKEDTAALHSAMEQQIIPISKANIQATLTAQTTLLAAANPKLGRFDPYTPIAAQIDLPSTLINRFDLIFPVRDIPDLEKDEKIAMHVLESSQKEETYATEISVKTLRNYVSYAKRLKPKMTKGAVEEIKNFYVALRNSGREEGGVKPIPISARQLEGIIRLAEASARIRLDENITKEDAKRAIELLRYCLMQVGFDPETGQIDIDRISTGITASARGKIVAIRDIINLLTSKGLKEIPIEEIYSEAAAKAIEEEKVDEAITQLKKSGDIFEPKRGHISKVA